MEMRQRLWREISLNLDVGIVGASIGKAKGLNGVLLNL
jgi:hypothetical protein